MADEKFDISVSDLRAVSQNAMHEAQTPAAVALAGAAIAERLEAIEERLCGLMEIVAKSR